MQTIAASPSGRLVSLRKSVLGGTLQSLKIDILAMACMTSTAPNQPMGTALT